MGQQLTKYYQLLVNSHYLHQEVRGIKVVDVQQIKEHLYHLLDLIAVPSNEAHKIELMLT